MILTLAGCTSGLRSPTLASATPQANAPSPTSSAATPTVSFDLSAYAFPTSIDPRRYYLFYLHGKIIEDQGLDAASPEYGPYQYQAILERLHSYGFVVISEQRPKNADGLTYARKTADQIKALLAAGTPAGQITVVGASKGAGIAILTSSLLQNPEVNYVFLSICNPDVVADLIQNQASVSGNILSIYDNGDEYAGSCQGLVEAANSRAVTTFEEVQLHLGAGHGILYQPLDAWIVPTVQWAGIPLD